MIFFRQIPKLALFSAQKLLAAMPSKAQPLHRRLLCAVLVTLALAALEALPDLSKFP